MFSLSPWIGSKALVVEPDSKVAISPVCNCNSRPWKIWQVFNEIDRLRKVIGHVEFVHTFREANASGDSLAKLGVDRNDFFVAWW